MPSPAQSGLSLVECLVTLSIVAVLTAIAYPLLRTLVAERTVTHAADRLAATLALGRSIADAALVPPAGHASFNHGWKLVPTARPETPLLVVPLPERCLRVASRAARPQRREPGMRWTAVGYSRSEHSGFHAATFVVRCHGAQRQVRLGAQGRIRICRPHADPDCD